MAQLTVRSQGTFTDKTATAHRWYVNGAHTLVWDDKPYVPVGGRFVAKSWAATATDADYDADVAALKALAASGVSDIYVQAMGGGLTNVKPANIQKLVDYLDDNGFSYGVSINDGPREPLIGYVVRPGAHRQIVPPGGNLTFPVSNAASALFFTVSNIGGEVRESGEATVVGDTLRVAVKDETSSLAALAVGSGTVPTVAILLPERIFTASDNLQMRNLWDGFDPYRDALITLFAQVKFGKGFRFVCDPLPANLALTDAFTKVIPTSDAFRTEWAAYLGTKYRSLPNVISAWGVRDPLVTSFDDVSRLLPLWYGGKGIAHYYDTRSKKMLRAAWDRSAFWDDLSAFKRESVRGYMNDLAVTIKRTVADVPVVYRNGAGAGWNELFDDLPAAQGFDGFGIVATGRGSEAAARSGAYTFAQASEAPKTIWLPVLSASDEAKPFLDKQTLTGTFDWLREAGAKGFFANLSPTVPEQTDWLKSYATVLDSTGMRTRIESVGASQAPDAVFYPRRNQTDLVPTVLTTGGGWWLPTNRVGQVYDFGSTGRAYGIEEPNAGFVYYLWNPTGTRKITLNVPKTATDGKTANRVAWSANAQGELKKQTLTLTIGREPVRLLNYPVIPVPLETYPEARLETDALAKAAKTEKSLDYGRNKMNITEIYYKKDNPLPGVKEILALLARMRFEKRRYFWYDVEYAPAHSFDEISALPGASGNRVLRVDERLDNAPAAAQIKLNFGEESVRDVWLSVSPSALISLRLDGRPLMTVATIPITAGGLFANGSLIWTRFGTATIPKGEHVLEIRADGAALVDALLLARDPFSPDGANPPPVQP